MSTSLRKRGAIQKKASKRSQLEARLDDLVSLLQKQTATRESPQEGPISPTSFDSGSRALLSSDMPVSLPTLYLAAMDDIQQLSVEMPMTSLAIHAVCLRMDLRQIESSKQIWKILMDKLLVDCARSLDLLLGFLVWLVWSSYAASRRIYFGPLSALARSLVGDLGLDRSLHAGSLLAGPGPQANIPSTREELRALLACFSITVMVSMTANQQSMRWCRAIEQAVNELHKGDCEDDLVLVFLAKIARVCLSATDVCWTVSENPNAWHSTVVSLEPLRIALSHVKTELLASVAHHATVLTYFHAAEIQILVPALYAQFTSEKSHSEHYGSSTTIEHQALRLQHLTDLLTQCHSYCESFLQSNIAHLTAPSMLLFPYCMKIAFKLQNLEISGWNTVQAITYLNPVQYLQRAAQLAEDGNTLFKSRTGKDSVYKITAETLRRSAPFWSAKAMSALQDATTNEPTVDPENLDPETAHFVPSAEYYFDGMWVEQTHGNNFWNVGGFGL